MRKIILSLLLFSSSTLFAKGSDVLSEAKVVTPLQINQSYEKEYTLEILILSGILDKEEKISTCVQDYIKKQSKSYTKIAQGNLYDLIHNFNNTLSKIYGKKEKPSDISYEEKVETLAQIQCEAYYTMGILK